MSQIWGWEYNLFHLVATIAHIRNFISHLSMEDGSMVSDHDLKAGLLWSAFKDEFGISEYNEMLIDLASRI